MEKSPFKPAEVLQLHAERQVPAMSAQPGVPHAEESAAHHAAVPEQEPPKAARPSKAPASAPASR